MLKKLYYKYKTKDPYQDINDYYNMIFIHIPKNAGISIEEALFEKKVGHKTIRQFQAHDAKRFEKYWKFTIVRNPYDRLVSAFHFLKKGGLHEIDKAWADSNIGHIDTFKEFVFLLKDKSFEYNITKWQHFRQQSFYLKNFKNEIDIDYIAKFENLSEEFDYIKNQLSLKDQILQHKNKSSRNHWSEYYDDKEMLEIVYRIYEEDFSNFGYKRGTNE